MAGIKMNIRLAHMTDAHCWNEYVLRNPASSPHQLFEWGLSINAAYKHPMYYLMAEEGSEITGVLPLIYMKPPFFRGHLVSLPYCDVGGELADNRKAFDSLFLEAITLAKILKVKQLEIRQWGTARFALKSSLPVRTGREKVSMILPLPESSHVLFEGFKSKLRSQIRKAIKNNLRFRWGTLEDLNDFYRVFGFNMKLLGSPVHSKKWFHVLLNNFREKARLALVYYGQVPVGAALILCHGQFVSIPWASTLREYNYLSPNMLLYWNVLKFAADEGYRQFDFGRCTPGEGTYKFKAQWGAEAVPLNWHYIFLGEAAEDVQKRPGLKNKRDALAKVWSAIPLPVTNVIGPPLRKYISL